MVRSDENNPTVITISRPNVQALGGKTMGMATAAVPNRRALSNINRNIIIAPPNHCTVHRESSHEPKKDQVLAKNQFIPPSRPITRRFAAQMSSIQQQSASEGNNENLNRPVSSSSEAQDSEIIDIDDDDDMSVPSYVQHTQAMLEEIDLMDEEMEEDVAEHLVQDIDSCDRKNPLAVVEYTDDILAHYKRTEGASLVLPNYMDHQKDINGKMRAILIDWLIEVHYKFELMEETLYLAVNLIDRFLERQQVVRKKLQLVGVTAMLIACKYEEVSVPVVEDFIVITDKAYTKREVIQMERLMVNTLQFNLSLPTPYMFMRRFLKAAASQFDNKLELLSLFMVELCLVEYEMLKYPPSMLSAAAVFTAQCILCGHKNWNMACEWHSGYSQDQLLECARMMVFLHQNAGSGKLTGVHRKYSTSKFGYAAKSEPALFLLETWF